MPLPIRAGDNLSEECPDCGSRAFEDFTPDGVEGLHLCQCKCGRAWNYAEVAALDDVEL